MLTAVFGLNPVQLLTVVSGLIALVLTWGLLRALGLRRDTRGFQYTWLLLTLLLVGAGLKLVFGYRVFG